MIAYRLFNRTDMVFSATPALAGGHGSLAHPPGSGFWGRAAGGFYRAPDADTFALAHSGRLRFSPAFPLVDGGVAFPAPQTLREPKHERGGVEDGKLTKSTWNMLRTSGPSDKPGEAGEALKGYFVTGAGGARRPTRGERGKTANVEHDRRSDDGQFFQYEFLSAGQEWVTWIEGDEAALASISPMANISRTGKARRKDFGGDFDAEPWLGWRDPREEQWKETAPAELVLWCLSDLACVDEWGAPCFEPTPEQLGVGTFAGRLNRKKSAIFTRRYAPWNAWLDGRDREQAVIEAGSVLVYDLTAPIELAIFREGCGRWRERGLGLVWPNPPLLREPWPANLVSVSRDAGSAPPRDLALSKPAPPLSDREKRLLAQLRGRAEHKVQSDQLAASASVLAGDLDKRLVTARKRGEATPASSQWAQLAMTAESAKSHVAFKEALFGKTGMCVGGRNADWRPVARMLQAWVDRTPPVPLQVFARAAWRMRDLVEERE